MRQRISARVRVVAVIPLLGAFKDDAEDNGQPGNDRESFQSDDGENDPGS